VNRSKSTARLAAVSGGTSLTRQQEDDLLDDEEFESDSEDFEKRPRLADFLEFATLSRCQSEAAVGVAGLNKHALYAHVEHDDKEPLASRLAASLARAASKRGDPNAYYRLDQASYPTRNGRVLKAIADKRLKLVVASEASFEPRSVRFRHVTRLDAVEFAIPTTYHLASVDAIVWCTGHSDSCDWLDVPDTIEVISSARSRWVDGRRDRVSRDHDDDVIEKDASMFAAAASTTSKMKRKKSFDGIRRSSSFFSSATDLEAVEAEATSSFFSTKAPTTTTTTKAASRESTSFFSTTSSSTTTLTLSSGSSSGSSSGAAETLTTTTPKATTRRFRDDDNSGPAVLLDVRSYFDPKAPLMPRRWYKHCFPAPFGGKLAFFGWAQPQQGGETQCAELLARYHALLLAGDRQLPLDYYERAVAEGDAEATYYANCNRATLVDYPSFCDSVATLVGCKPEPPGSCGALLQYWLYPAWGYWYRSTGPGKDPRLLTDVLRRFPVAQGLRSTPGTGTPFFGLHLLTLVTVLFSLVQRFLTVLVLLLPTDLFRRPALASPGWQFLKPKHTLLHGNDLSWSHAVFV